MSNAGPKSTIRVVDIDNSHHDRYSLTLNSKTWLVMTVQPASPNLFWLRGTSIFMSLMFLFSLATIASSVATPVIVETYWPGEWSEIAGDYPENGTTNEQDEWVEGERFWNESVDYWEALVDSGLFEISAGFGFIMALISAASVPVLWSGDRNLGLRLCLSWVVVLMISQILTTMLYYEVGFIPEYSEFELNGELKWMNYVEKVGLTFSMAQILICNSCLFACIFIVAARSKPPKNGFDLESAFHRSEG